MRDVVCHYGVPLELHSNQGRNFESTVFAEMCLLLVKLQAAQTPDTMKDAKGDDTCLKCNLSNHCIAVLETANPRRFSLADY